MLKPSPTRPSALHTHGIQHRCLALGGHLDLQLFRARRNGSERHTKTSQVALAGGAGEPRERAAVVMAEMAAVVMAVLSLYMVRKKM